MKEQKSSNRFLRYAFFIAMVLNFICINSPVIAAEKIARLVEVDLPEPAEGFKLGPFDCSDKWIVWTEFGGMRHFPRKHVPVYHFKVFRGKTGTKDRQELLDIPFTRSYPLVYITNEGMALIGRERREGENLCLFLPNGKKQILKSTLDMRPFELFSDGLIAGIEQKSGRGKLVFCKITKAGNLTSTIVLEENFVTDGSVFDYRYSDRKVISRYGTKVAWINGNPRGEANIVVADFETGERKIVGKSMKLLNSYPYPLEMDGLYGNWLLCHQGTIARLINIENCSQLQLPSPGEVKYFCPDGVLFKIEDYHHRLWDPVLQKRWDFICDPKATFFNITNRTKAGMRIYILEPYQYQGSRVSEKRLERPPVSYFSTKDQMVDVPAQLLAETATATKACKKAYESDKGGWDLWTAMLSLRWPYPPETIPLMELILNSSKGANVRNAAAHRIAFSNDPAARQILLKALKKKKDWFVREQILVYLGFSCDKADAISIIKQKPRGVFVEKAADTLGILGNSAALEYLQKHTSIKFSHKESQDKARASVRNAIRYINMRSEFETVLKNLRTASHK
jgi:hypothetical protein